MSSGMFVFWVAGAAFTAAAAAAEAVYSFADWQMSKCSVCCGIMNTFSLWVSKQMMLFDADCTRHCRRHTHRGFFPLNSLQEFFSQVL